MLSEHLLVQVGGRNKGYEDNLCCVLHHVDSPSSLPLCLKAVKDEACQVCWTCAQCANCIKLVCVRALLMHTAHPCWVSSQALMPAALPQERLLPDIAGIDISLPLPFFPLHEARMT